MRDKNYSIFWNFNGKVYFGGWDRDNTKTEANKHGIGLEWVPKSKQGFMQVIHISESFERTKDRATGS